MLEQLSNLLKQKKSNAFYAEKLGITISEVEELKKELRENNKVEENEETVYFHNIAKEEIEIKSFYKNPPTPEQIVKDHNIDTTKYKLSGYWSKQKTNGWQISALFTQKSEIDKQPDLIQNILNNYNTTYQPIRKGDLLINVNDSPCCALISLPDFHLDKKEITGTSIQEKVDNYSKVLENLLYRSYRSHYLEEIVFLLGNDFFQTDTIQGTTTKGTPVAIDMDWDDAYEVGFDLMVTSINKLKQFCNKLHIYLIPGNHPKTKEFYLSHALEVYFKSDKNIIFHRSSTEYKVHIYGETLLCFNHGNNINEKLPLMFATSFYKEWGSCRYKEIILGDKHHNTEKVIRSMQGEAQGVRMRILPALCGTDKWHEDNLFTNSIQSGISLIYDKKNGKCSEFEHRI